MFVEAMEAIRRLVERAPGRHQQMHPLECAEQRIPPQLESSLGHRLTQQIVQLARADTGLTKTHFAHQLSHVDITLLTGLLSLNLLVVRLSADAQVTTSTGEWQASY